MRTVSPAVLALLSWGVMDFLVKLAVDRVEVRRVLFGAQVAGFVLCLLLLPAAPSGANPQIPWGLVVLASVLYVAANLCLFLGFAAGPLSIVSPLVATYSGLGILLAVVWLGERPSLVQWAATLAVITGVALVARTPSPAHQDVVRPNTAGIVYAIGTVLLMAPLMVVVRPLAEALTPFRAVFLIKVGALLLLFPVAWPPWQGMGRASDLWLIGIIGVLEVGASFFYALGVVRGGVTITAPVASAAPVVTVLLARRFLRERMTTAQAIGIALILAGIGVLGAT